MPDLDVAPLICAARLARETVRPPQGYLPLSTCRASTAGSNGRHEALLASQSALLVRQIGNLLWPTLPLPIVEDD